MIPDSAAVLILKPLIGALKMARPHKIWFWKARGEWCVKIDNIRHRLGPDKDQADSITFIRGSMLTIGATRTAAGR